MSDFVDGGKDGDASALSSSSSSSGSGIQRKNLMKAKLFDSEVQQDIFPELAHGDASRNITLSDSSVIGEEMSARIRAQAAAVEDIDSALGGLSQWRNALKEGSSSSIDSSTMIGSENEKYAKLVAFVDEELKVSLNIDSDGKEGLHDQSHARLRALSKRRDAGGDEKAEGNFAHVISSNAELAHMRSSCLGKDYMGLENLEATKNQLLAELEMDEKQMAKLEKKLNRKRWDDIDIDGIP